MGTYDINKLKSDFASFKEPSQFYQHFTEISNVITKNQLMDGEDAVSAVFQTTFLCFVNKSDSGFEFNRIDFVDQKLTIKNSKEEFGKMFKFLKSNHCRS